MLSFRRGVHGFGLLSFAVALTGIPLAIAYPVLSSVGGVTLLAVLLFGSAAVASSLQRFSPDYRRPDLLQGVHGETKTAEAVWPVRSTGTP